MVSNMSSLLHKRKSLLDTALRCRMERLQGVCLTEMVMEIIDLARERAKQIRYNSSNPHLPYVVGQLRTTLSPKFDELFSYDLHPEVRKRLNNAMAELMYYGIAGSLDNMFYGLERKHIESILI